MNDQPNLSPPWVLFTDNGKPIAILPAGRPGEVADVRHLSAKEASNLVRLGNELHHAIVMARLRGLQAQVTDMTERFRLATTSPRNTTDE